MMWGYGPGGASGYMVGHMYGSGLLLALLVVAIVVGAILWFARAGNGSGLATGDTRPKALHLLDERYARGEIERDDYLQRKKDLQA